MPVASATLQRPGAPGKFRSARIGALEHARRERVSLQLYGRESPAMTLMTTQGAALKRPLYRALLAMLLAGAGDSIAAELWAKVGESEKFRAYAMPASMRREGAIVKIWDMFDYRMAQVGDGGKKYLSMKRHTEYDCKQGKMRVFELSYHSDNLTKGEVVHAAKVNFKWSEVATGSADLLLLEFACGIKDQDKGGESMKKIPPMLPGK